MINFIKRFFIKHPFLYKLTRFPVIFLRYLFRQVHDEDFLFFKNLDLNKRGLFLDIGANSGQAAMTFAILSKQFHIISFEPNVYLEKELKVVKHFLGKRFEYFMVGAGDVNVAMDFFIPLKQGVLMSEEGSFSYSKQLSENTKKRLGKNYKIIKHKFNIKRIDNFDLYPDIIKIDVEGFEHKAVLGMLKTIKKNKPILLIEERSNKEEIFDLLKPLGYHFYHYTKKTNSLTEFKDGTDCLNYFCIFKNSL